jgi:hypothetical protein
MTFNNIILAIQAFLAIITLVVAIMTYRTRKAIQEIHLSLNSRLDALLKSEKAISKEEGRNEPRI